MIKIKRFSVAAGLGAALAFAFAAPVAAHGSFQGGAKDDVKYGDVVFLNGEDQYCDVRGTIVIIKNSCNGNGNKGNDSRNGNVDD